MGKKSTVAPHNIREMNLETDLDQVKKIWLNGAKKVHHPYISENFWDSRLPEMIEETKNAKEKYVYEENDKIVGFITARNDGYIFEIYVDFQKEDFRRRGIGRALFETLKGENPKFPQLKGVYSKFTSSVYRHNYESFAWHIKCDFKVFGISFCSHTGLPKFEMVWKKEANCVV